MSGAHARDDRRTLEEIVAGQMADGDKMRALAEAGCEAAEIADLLGLDFVRVSEFLGGPVLPAVRVGVGPGGRIVIPASYRRAMNIQPGDQLVLRFADGELRAVSSAEGLRRAQRRVAKYVPRDRSLVDELIAERRLEAEREDSE